MEDDKTMTTHFQPANKAIQEVKPWRLDSEKIVLPLSNPNPQYAVVMVMAGDDSVLGPYLSRDLMEMSKGVTGGKEVSVLALADGLAPGKTVVFEFSRGKYQEIYTCNGLDTGDPRPLADFLTLALDSYAPETRIAMGFWGHGSGVFGDIDPYENLLPESLLELPLGTKITEAMFLENYLSEPTPYKPFVSRAMLPDASSGGVLTNRELNSALAVAFSRSGRTEPVDLIFFDTCLNGSAEVYAELRRYARCFAASALKLPGTGWNYTWFLQMTRRYQPEDARSWAEIAVRAFDKTYDQSLFPIPAQLMAMGADGAFLPKFREISARLLELGDRGREILFEALGKVETIGEDESVDICGLVTALGEFSNDETMGAFCEDFLGAYQSELIALSQPPNDGKFHTGLTVWFPRLGDTKKVESYYANLKFHRETGWLDVVRDLIHQKPAVKPSSTFLVLGVSGLELKEAREVERTHILQEGEEQRFVLNIPEGSEAWVDSLCEGEYEFQSLSSMTPSLEAMLKLVKLALSLRRKDDEFLPLEALGRGDIVLGAETSRKLAHDLEKYERIVIDEFQGFAKAYWLLKKLALRGAESGALLFGGI